jgi:hypothetical protein
MRSPMSTVRPCAIALLAVAAAAAQSTTVNVQVGNQTDTSVGVKGRLQLPMSTSFQLADWNYQFFNGEASAPRAVDSSQSVAHAGAGRLGWHPAHGPRHLGFHGARHHALHHPGYRRPQPRVPDRYGTSVPERQPRPHSSRQHPHLRSDERQHGQLLQHRRIYRQQHALPKSHPLPGHLVGHLQRAGHQRRNGVGVRDALQHSRAPDGPGRSVHQVCGRRTCGGSR